MTEARAGIERYFRFYNHERLHQSLDYRTPAAVHLAGEHAEDEEEEDRID